MFRLFGVKEGLLISPGWECLFSGQLPSGFAIVRVSLCMNPFKHTLVNRLGEGAAGVVWRFLDEQSHIV